MTEITRTPAHSREETARYTELLADGRSRQFNFVMGCKSVILRPSGRMEMQGAGLSLRGEKPLKTFTSFWPYAPLIYDYIRRAMPLMAPGSLPSDDS